MPEPSDLRHRRIAVAVVGAVLLVAAGHRNPMIGTVSICLDERLVPEIAAAWSPPVAVALSGAGQVASALGIAPGISSGR